MISSMLLSVKKVLIIDIIFLFPYDEIKNGIAMILINIDSLSTSELRNIAQQEAIEEYADMEREDLIQALVEKYEEEDDNYVPEGHSEAPNLRYMAGLTDYRAISDSVVELPGVEGLPAFYPETSIHLLYKNANWGYAFWTITENKKEMLLEKGAKTALFVSIRDENGEREQYDIPISLDDTEWNIGYTSYGVDSVIALVADYPNGEREVLAKSNTIHLPKSFWINHQSEMKENDDLFKIYLSIITTKEGAIINNPLVSDILNAYAKEDIRNE